MGDLWADEGFGGGGFALDGFGDEDDWDSGEESMESGLEEGFDEPDEPHEPQAVEPERDEDGEG